MSSPEKQIEALCQQAKEIITNASKTPPVVSKKDIRVVILQRGWVLVGEYSRVGDECFLANSRSIRQWGTTKGIGEIVENGPTNKTVLDLGGLASFHRLTVVCDFQCNADKWLSHLS